MLNRRPLTRPLPPRRPARAAALRQRGGSLIEVLVSAALLATGLLAMTWSHATAIRYDKMSQFRGIATQMASGLADRIRANADAAANYATAAAYAPATPSPVVVNCAASACSATQMAAYDMAVQRNAIRRLLPDGDLHVTVDAAGVLTLWVLWRDPEAIDDAAGSASLASGCPASAIATAPAPLPQCLAVRVRP